ncbi:retinol-binding protein pinta-like isoform X1 [Microplitis mediator]|uniref:retinol-binding protein pinta-like isoform X1 n=1 Tax=Microplitis mediator TaxID=375433 RepID=UPI0025544D2F|nr:retinol-binding protein pinta-like isoform X1 [Microplitis mediator]
MNIRELPDGLKKFAKEELGEDDNHLIEDVNYIVEWLKKQPHLHVRTDPQWIVGFLRGCKHSLERTKKKLDAYYTIRTHLPELFLDRDPKQSKIQKILEMGTYLPLPKTDKPDGPRVILVRGAIYDPKKCTFQEVLKIFFMIMDILLLEDDWLNVEGQDTVLDLSGSRLEHASQFTPAVIKKAVTCFQDAYPIKTKSLHFINAPPTFDAIFAIFKRFMSDKLRKRIMVHSEMEKVFDYIPKRVFPSDYGGDAPSIAQLTKEWKKKVIEKQEWFVEDSQYRVTESKRPGKPITGLDLFGVEGSFKQLEFD